MGRPPPPPPRAVDHSRDASQRRSRGRRHDKDPGPRRGLLPRPHSVLLGARAEDRGPGDCQPMITDLTVGDSRHSCVPDRPSLLKQTPGREPSRREWVSPRLLVRPSEEAATSAHCPPQSRAVPGSWLTAPLAAVTLVHDAGDAILFEPDKQKVATTSYPGLPRTFLGLKLKVPHPGSPLSLGQALQGFHQGAHQTGGRRTLSHSGPLTPGNRHRVTSLVGMVVLEGG